MDVCLCFTPRSPRFSPPFSPPDPHGAGRPRGGASGKGRGPICKNFKNKALSRINFGLSFNVFTDVDIYVFLEAIIATGLRWLAVRRLWTRYTNRGIVIVDSTVNYKLLRAYTSKLKALAYSFTTFGVSG